MFVSGRKFQRNLSEISQPRPVNRAEFQNQLKLHQIIAVIGNIIYYYSNSDDIEEIYHDSSEEGSLADCDKK